MVRIVSYNLIRYQKLVTMLVCLITFSLAVGWKVLAQSNSSIQAPPDYSSGSTETVTTDNNLTEIRVLLGDKFNSCTIYFSKGYRVYSDTGQLLEEAPEATSANIVALPGRVKISNKSIESKGLFFQPLSGGYTGFIKLKFRGVMRVFSSSNDKLAVVNHLPLEDYVRAVVPGEMPCTWSLDALKAQTVAARTYAVNRLLKYRQQSYDVSDGQEDQVYLGLTKEREQTNRAATETANIIATYKGQPIIAYFSSDAGGKTNQNDAYPYLKSVPSYVPSSPHNGWSWQGSFVELENMLKRKHPKAGLLINLTSELDPVSERMKRVTFVTTSGSITVSANTFRNLINPSKLKSTAFRISLQSGSSGIQTLTYNARPDAICIEGSRTSTSAKVVGASVVSINGLDIIDLPPRVAYIESAQEKMVVVKGNGWGHGSGLSQWGAYELAKNGWDWVRILKHFYTGIDLTPIKQIKIPPPAIPSPINLSTGSVAVNLKNLHLEQVKVEKTEVQPPVVKPETKPGTKPKEPNPKLPPGNEKPKPKEKPEDNEDDDSPEPLPLPPGS